MVSVEKVLADALLLSETDRHRIARELVVSLDVGSEDVTDAWAAEIGSRVQDIVDGTVEMIEGDEADRQLRARLGRS